MSVDDKAERDKSLRIDRELEEDHKQLKRECKILLLGKNCYWRRVYQSLMFYSRKW